MKFTKIEEQRGQYLLVYFTDPQQRKQGELLCYRIDGKFPSQENLLFTEEYKDGTLLDRRWIKLPEVIVV